ncbi:hypothetical protein RchiOBHm_Chr6g0283791 [Rosa chinensis]|uniref:Uncharacterized protein n=1 Tax=Rosa chinensis TaxID=74649 RepID=A0A2P6PU32_ROSCH|nr:hypothetical protein RchiOBHm_Chr6g0283791 [Rosa chinensis]
MEKMEDNSGYESSAKAALLLVVRRCCSCEVRDKDMGEVSAPNWM